MNVRAWHSFCGQLGDLSARHRRKLLVKQHVDGLVQEMHRAVGKQKVGSARVVAAEVGCDMRTVLGGRSASSRRLWLALVANVQRGLVSHRMSDWKLVDRLQHILIELIQPTRLSWRTSLIDCI